MNRLSVKQLTVLLADGSRYAMPTERTPMNPTAQKIDPPNHVLPGVPAPAVAPAITEAKRTRVRQPVTPVIALARIANILAPLAESVRHDILEMLASPIPNDVAGHLAACERLLSHLDAAGRRQVVQFLVASESVKGGAA